MRRPIHLAAIIISVLSFFSQHLFSLPYEGSKDEEKILSDISALAKKLDFPVLDFPVIKKDAFHSFSHIVIVRIQGISKERRAIILPVSMPPGIPEDDYDPHAARDLALRIMNVLKISIPYYTLDLIMTGAHDGLADGPGIRFLEDSSLLSEDQAVLEFGAFRPGKGWCMDLDKNRANLAQWLFGDILASAGEHRNLFSNTSFDFLRQISTGGTQRANKTDDSRPPWCIIISSTENKPGPSSDPALPFLLAFTENRGFQPSATTSMGNYLPAGSGGNFLVIDEPSSVSMVFIWTALVLLAIFRRGRRRAYLRSFLRNIPHFFLMTGVWFISVFAAHGLSGLPAWHEAMGDQFIPEFIVSITVMAILRLPLGTFFPRQGSFHSASALFAVIVLVYSGIFQSICLGFPLVILASLLLASFQLKNPVVKTIFWVSSIIFVSIGLTLLSGPAETSIQSKPGALPLFMLTLPLFFQGARLRLLWKLRSRHRRIRYLVFLFALIVAIIVWAGINSSGKKAPDHGIPIPQNQLENLSQLESAGMKLVFRQASFLNRIEHTINFEASRPVRQIRLQLSSGSALSVLSCNFPFVYLSNQMIEVQIGINPDFPLSIDLVLPENQKVKVSLKVLTAGNLDQVSGILGYDWEW